MIKRIGFISIALIMLMSVGVKADYETPTRIRCTCYTATEGSITASGEHVREGIVAGKRDWLGKVAILYDLNMNIIGIYEFKDTGAGIDTDGDGKGDSIKKGKSIDVYRDTLDECYDWIRTYGDYVLMMIVD